MGNLEACFDRNPTRIWRCVRHSSRGPKSRQVDGWWWSAIRTIVVQLLAPVERASAGGAESETEAVVAAFGRSPSAIILIMQWKRRCEKGCFSGFYARFRQFMASFVARRMCPRNRSLRRGECKIRRGPPVPLAFHPQSSNPGIVRKFYYWRYRICSFWEFAKNTLEQRKSHGRTTMWKCGHVGGTVEVLLT